MTIHAYCLSRPYPKPYHSWQGMKSRCYNPKNNRYHDYGGRGITVCDRWFNSFPNFITDVGWPPTDKHTIDRINTNGNYEPDNVKWSTPKEQANNRRKGKYPETRKSLQLTCLGITKTIKEWVKESPVGKTTIRRRLDDGWSHEDAVLKPRTYPMKTSKMTRLLGKTLLVITLICSGCAMDKYRADGRIIKLEGKYYRLNNTMGNVYKLDPVYMDSVIVVK